MTSRRHLCLYLPALAAAARTTAAAEPQSEAAQASPHESVLPPQPSGTATLKDNAIFRAATMPITHTDAGSLQQVTHGTLPTGEGVELHNSTLAAGHEPHPPHRHPHEEFIFLRAGTVDWLIDGVRQPAGPGDILYAASNVLHGMRNTGTETASYFVMAIGPNLKDS